MSKRFVSIWFRYLQTDWYTIRKPELRGVPIVMASPDHGRLVITESNLIAHAQGIERGMVVADARAIVPLLQVVQERPGLREKLLKGIADWCIRYTPVVSVDPTGGIFLDVTGCTHLWGGEQAYLTDICNRLNHLGYTVQGALADTIGAAWGLARYRKDFPIIPPGEQAAALIPLPPAALRLEADLIHSFHKLGFREIGDLINISKKTLRRRFGQGFIKQLEYALGHIEEFIFPVQQVESFQERLPCLDPIASAAGIQIALERLLDALCNRLLKEQKGLREAKLIAYRIDGKIEEVSIATTRPSNSVKHLFKLFETKLPSIEPALGIELFLIEAKGVEDVTSTQETIWQKSSSLNDSSLSELLDRIANRIGESSIHRFIPDEHHWPERSVVQCKDLHATTVSAWKLDRPRPVSLLQKPELVEVTAPIPDYPPMNFRYRGKIHKIRKADGPERIEPEWWIQTGQHRDYYVVEDEEGSRYWLFRLGHYDASKSYQWFIHGFFA